MTVKSKLTRVTLAATGRAIGDRVAGKTPIFNILMRSWRVYTRITLNASSATLFPVMARKVVPDSIVYSDG